MPPLKLPDNNRSSSPDTTQSIIESIKDLKSLKDYPIRALVNHAEKFGKELRDQRLETNQIRKFLDAINRLKSKLVGSQFSEIEAIARNCDKKILKEIGLFDVYEGKNLEEGKKSYAVSFQFQDAENTLKDNQIDAIIASLISIHCLVQNK